MQTTAQRRLHARHQRDRAAVYWALEWSDAPRHAKRAERIRACCSHPTLRVDDSGGIRVALTRCRDRLCPYCSGRRAHEAGERLATAIRAMDAPRHLVLTAPATDAPLAEQLASLRHAFRTLRRGRSWRRSQAGGVYSVEVTRNPRTGRWHPHLHVVMDGHYWPHADAVAAWRSALQASPTWTGVADDDPIIVHLAAIHSRGQAARYIAKYVAKPAELAGWPPAAVLEFADALHGVRLVHAFGALHGVRLAPPDPNEDPAASEALVSLPTLERAARAGSPTAREAVALLPRVVPAAAPWVAWVPPPETAALADAHDHPADRLRALARCVAQGCEHPDHRPRPRRTLQMELPR